MTNRRDGGLVAGLIFPAALLVLGSVCLTAAEPLIIDHHDVDITSLSADQIHRAKTTLHIAYGHTSHGSQLTTGMSGLVGFANGGGLGLSLPQNIFAWNHGGTGGALDLHDYAMGGDVGYWPDWYNNTVSYLNNPANADVNVIIWSWCGQMTGKFVGGTLTNEYLVPMSMLETAYPNVVFVYMTGHVDIGSDYNQMNFTTDANQKAACQAIRDYCIAHRKVLYDFADIEHYDPDGVYYEYVNDNCGIYASPGGALIGNWATSWQGAHTVNVDWYVCESAHSQPLNANRKAYAAWALWCALAADLDRDGILDEWEERYGGCGRFCGGTNDWDRDGMTDTAEFVADTNPTNSASRFCLAGILATNSCSVLFQSSVDRLYSLERVEGITTGQWHLVLGQTNRLGEPGTMTLTDPAAAGQGLYRVRVNVP